MDHIVEREFSARRALSRHLFESIQPSVIASATVICECLKGGGKVLLCGNGGSASDAQHVAAELVGRFVMERRPLPAVALTTDTSILTAVANDYGFEQIFARQVRALATPQDVLVAISTSGNSANVLAAVEAAESIGCRVVGLTGRGGGALASRCEPCVVVPSDTTAMIQEVHIMVGHIWCSAVDHELAIA